MPIRRRLREANPLGSSARNQLLRITTSPCEPRRRTPPPPLLGSTCQPDGILTLAVLSGSVTLCSATGEPEAVADVVRAGDALEAGWVPGCQTLINCWSMGLTVAPNCDALL